MELKLKGHGTIKITSATLVEGGDILIEAEDGFAEIAKTTDYEITKAYLVENNFKWSLVLWLNLPEYEWYDNDTIIFRIENQDDVYKLNALL